MTTTVEIPTENPTGPPADDSRARYRERGKAVAEYTETMKPKPTTTEAMVAALCAMDRMRDALSADRQAVANDLADKLDAAGNVRSLTIGGVMVEVNSPTFEAIDAGALDEALGVLVADGVLTQAQRRAAVERVKSQVQLKPSRRELTKLRALNDERVTAAIDGSIERVPQSRTARIRPLRKSKQQAAA